MDESVSVIIPTYNRLALIRDCIRSLQQSTRQPEEIIVIDDAGTDRTAEELPALFPGIRLIRNPNNRGAAYSKNRGIRIARGTYLWFLDNDAQITDPSCLAQMLALMEAHPRIGCIGGELLNEDGKQYVRIDGFRQSRKVLFDAQTKTQFLLHPVRSLMTSNLFTRRQLVLSLGGFDGVFGYLSEDTDLCLRMRAHGYEVILDSRTLVLHRYSPVARKSNFARLFRNEMRCALKNRGIPYGLFAEPLRLLRNIVLAARDQRRHHRTLRETVRVTAVDTQQPAWLNTVMLAGTILAALGYAYAANILLLPQTIRRRSSNPLEEEKLRDEHT